MYIIFYLLQSAHKLNIVTNVSLKSAEALDKVVWFADLYTILCQGRSEVLHSEGVAAVFALGLRGLTRAPHLAVLQCIIGNV